MTTTTISLRLRLFLAFGFILFLALGVPAYYLHQNLGQISEREAYDGARRDLRAVEWMLSLSSFNSLAEVNEALRDLAARMDIRVTFIDLDGRVLTDSGVTAERVGKLENHLGRPEVTQALAGEIGISLRYSDTVNQDLLYAAMRTQASGIMPEGVVRIARPQSQIRKTWIGSTVARAGFMDSASFWPSVLSP